MERSVDSRLEIVETWATRKDSYWAKSDDMESKDRREEQGGRGGRAGDRPALEVAGIGD